ncbi:PREDICTED: carboxypeptidase B-like [Priapulus caudatus]|uniref:Carboxypeptidase B-like n=1 Tax=Priapulus caudatus TaxID=37621 RepID=A0ABM1FBL8_PRICU|nr:PREDICTED: carboxypeptidase B-like [Priapulus caudatus]
MSWCVMLLLCACVLCCHATPVKPDDESQQTTSQERLTYIGHKVVRMTPTNYDQVEFLRSLMDQALPLDFWIYPGNPGRPVDIRIPPTVYDSVISVLKQHGLNPLVLIDDVQKLVDEERLENLATKAESRHRFIRSAAGNEVDGRVEAEILTPYNPVYSLNPSPNDSQQFMLNHYHTNDEINGMVLELAASSPFVTASSIGTSYEGRPLTIVKITTPSNDRSLVKPAIFLEAGMHAREWIGPAVIIYFIAALVNNYNVDPNVRAIVDHFDWYLMPVSNPDGYVYTFQWDRMWRKTRSRTEEQDVSSRRACAGVDPNRNWDTHWGERGASHKPCSIIYAGQEAFSEPEVAAMARFLMGRKSRIKLAIDFHSNGQMWLTPYGYTRRYPMDFEAQYMLAVDATDELWKVNNTIYIVGSVANSIYRASGDSIDWWYDVAGIKYSYGVELPGKGYHDFILPPSRIVPVGVETFEAIKYMALEVMREAVERE